MLINEEEKRVKRERKRRKDEWNEGRKDEWKEGEENDRKRRKNGSHIKERKRRVSEKERK